MYDYELYADPDYVGGLTLVERWVAYSLEMVERLGLFINTLTIWTIDHGHLLGEHSLQGKPDPELGRLYEATTRVPLLLRQPRGLGVGQYIKDIVQPPAFFPPFWSSSP
jgi:arylsulfatase A-like enzyme